MRVLGLDIGDRRVGIAVSDETGTIAQGRGTYLRTSLGEDVVYLARLAHEVGAVAILVGLPLNMDGTEGEQARKTREVAEPVAAKAHLPLHYVDERLTTSEATRVLGEGGLSRRKRKERTDELSAVLILQAWLDQPDES
jgi:putative Holliday junction resolvase